MTQAIAIFNYTTCRRPADGRTAVGSFTFPPSFKAPVAVAPAPAATPAVVQIIAAPPPGDAFLTAPEPLPLLVMSHQNNASVGHDATVIRGRTAPFATVNVRVDAIAPANRRMEASVAQRLLSETVQADANGDFAFDFNPRYWQDNASSLPVPGTRYDLSLSATRDNASTESRLQLFQRS